MAEEEKTGQFLLRFALLLLLLLKKMNAETLTSRNEVYTRKIFAISGSHFKENIDYSQLLWDHNFADLG